jgi:hypothetical protein
MTDHDRFYGARWRSRSIAAPLEDLVKRIASLAAAALAACATLFGLAVIAFIAEPARFARDAVVVLPRVVVKPPATPVAERTGGETRAAFARVLPPT